MLVCLGCCSLSLGLKSLVTPSQKAAAQRPLCFACAHTGIRFPLPLSNSCALLPLRCTDTGSLLGGTGGAGEGGGAAGFARTSVTPDGSLHGPGHHLLPHHYHRTSAAVTASASAAAGAGVGGAAALLAAVAGAAGGLAGTWGDPSTEDDDGDDDSTGGGGASPMADVMSRPIGTELTSI